MADWNALLDPVENTPRSPLRPQMVIRTLNDLLADDAVISLVAAPTSISRPAVCASGPASASLARGYWPAWRLVCLTRSPRNGRRSVRRRRPSYPQRPPKVAARRCWWWRTMPGSVA